LSLQLRTHAEIFARWTPLYKHPLPDGIERFEAEVLYDRLRTTHPRKRVAAALAHGNPWVLEELYIRGCPVEEPVGRSEMRPVHLCCKFNFHECLQVLLNIGIDVNVRTIDGNTPLFMAVAADATECIHLLEEAGAKMEIKEPLPGFRTTIDADRLIDHPPTVEGRLQEFLGRRSPYRGQF